jgi:hypothetical protein
MKCHALGLIIPPNFAGMYPRSRHVSPSKKKTTPTLGILNISDVVIVLASRSHMGGTTLETLQNALAKLSELKGENFAILCLLICLIKSLPIDKRESFENDFEKEIELIRVEWLNSNISDHFVTGLENTLTVIRLLLSSGL